MTRRCRGSTLIEIVAAMSLLVIFTAAAARLLMINIHVLRDTHAAAAASIDLDLLLGRIKRDAWSAVQITVPADDRVTLTLADGRVILWQATDDGVAVRRDDAAADQRWPTPRKLRFAASSGGLLVRLADEPAMLLVSQPMRPGGGS